MKVFHIFEDISPLTNYLKEKYNLKSLFIFENDTDIIIDMIEVPKENRKQGIGTAVMQEIIFYADKNNKRILLTPGLRDKKHGTTSRSRLIKFYKRFGFVENKGRNKDYTISYSMYRNPKNV